jgi:hypothetical protein
VGTSAGGGEGIYNLNSSCVVENTIFFSTESPSLATGCAIHDAADSPLLDSLNKSDFHRPAVCYKYGNPVTSLDYGQMIAFLGGTIASVSGNTEADPQFEKQTAPSWDWHLAGDSSIKDLGLDLSDFFTHDRDGVRRSAAWSIGAYEKD